MLLPVLLDVAAPGFLIALGAIPILFGIAIITVAVLLIVHAIKKKKNK